MPQENVELVKSVQPTNVDLVEVFPENEVVDQAVQIAAEKCSCGRQGPGLRSGLRPDSPRQRSRIREGKVAAIRFYLDRAEALEAVGLSE